MEHCSLAQRLVKHWAPMPAREDEKRGNLYVVPTSGKLVCHICLQADVTQIMPLVRATAKPLWITSWLTNFLEFY